MLAPTVTCQHTLKYVAHTVKFLFTLATAVQLCKTSDSHSGVAEDVGNSGCDAASLGEWFLSFRSNVVSSYLRVPEMSGILRPATQRHIPQSPHPRIYNRSPTFLGRGHIPSIAIKNRRHLKRITQRGPWLNMLRASARTSQKTHSLLLIKVSHGRKHKRT
jgi:hypothetical protein